MGEAQQAWILAQQQYVADALAFVAGHGRSRRALPVPGTLPGVGDIAAQQAHQAQLVAHNAQIAALGRKKRSNIVANLPLPGTAAVSALTPEQAAFWYQAQLQQAQNEVAVAGRRKRSNIVASLPVPGSAAVSGLTPEQAAFWYQVRISPRLTKIVYSEKHEYLRFKN